MARKITYQQAIGEALAQEMERDETVIIMGEDVAGGAPARRARTMPGVASLASPRGLYAKYGDRVMDTPITESAFIGAAVGAATAGLRPVAELMFIDFMGVCFDQIFNQAAKFRYMFRRQGRNAGGDPHHVWRRLPRRRPAFAMPLSRVHPHSRAEGGDAGNAL